MSDSARRALFPLTFTLFLASCSWNIDDKALFTSYLAFSAIDAGQTRKASMMGAPELNPLLAREDNTPDMDKVLSLKIFGAAVIGLLLDASPQNRRELLGAANALQGGVVVWNQYALWRIEKERAGEDRFASRPPAFADGYFVLTAGEKETRPTLPPKRTGAGFTP